MPEQLHRLHGIVPPMITPLVNTNRLDVPGLERLVEHIVGGGVHGLFVLGTSGEGPSLDGRLRRGLIRRVCEQVAGRVPVLVGVTDTSLAESVSLAEYAAHAGARAVVLAPPPYFPVGPADMRRYVDAAASRMPLPVFLYNMPSHTKVWFDLDTVRHALDLPGVAGIKDSSGDVAYLESLCRLRRERADFLVFVGPELLLADAVRRGADGGVCGGANLDPALLVAMYHAAAAGQADSVAELQRRLIGLNTIYGFDDNSMGVIKGLKAALHYLGICSDAVAEPLCPLSRLARKELHNILRSLGYGPGWSKHKHRHFIHLTSSRLHYRRNLARLKE